MGEAVKRALKRARAAVRIQMDVATFPFGMMVVVIFQLPKQEKQTAVREENAEKHPEAQNSAQVQISQLIKTIYLL